MFDHSHVMYVSTDGSSELDLELQKKPNNSKMSFKKEEGKKGPWGSDFLLTCADPRDVLANPSSLHREFFVYFKKNKSNGKLARAKKRENLTEISCQTHAVRSVG